MNQFQPIVFAAGNGSRMTDLTSKMPKALLPIGNVPMIWYPVSLLQREGFESATIIVKESQQPEIERSLTEISQIDIRLNFVSIPDKEDWGTAESLRFLHKTGQLTEKQDLLLISADTITDVRLHMLGDLHRTNEATVTALFAPEINIADAQIPGGKQNKKLERDYVGLDGAMATRLVYLSAEADLDGQITLSKSFLKKNPNIDLHRDLVDGHLYLMKRSVLDFMEEEKKAKEAAMAKKKKTKGNASILAIKGELMPKLVKRQFQKRKPKADGDGDSDQSIQDKPKDDYRTGSLLSKLGLLAKQYSSHEGIKNDTPIKCFTYVASSEFCIRANNIAMYCEANRRLPKELLNRAAGEALSNRSGEEVPSVHPDVKLVRSTVGPECYVGAGCTIGERVLVKRSIIGKHCKIGNGVKINNSIIMGYVTIEDGCEITGSVICEYVEVGEKSVLGNSIVAASQKLNDMSRFTNEAVIDMEKMMEIV